MKITTSNLCGLAYLAIVIFSSDVGAAEFTCDPGPQNCLYDSVAAANQTNEADVIRFTAGVHHSTALVGTRCAPHIVGDITIIGAGNTNTYLDAQGSCPFFHVNSGSSLTLRDIVAANGYLQQLDEGEILYGAGVYNEGLLRVERTFFRGNSINENLGPLTAGAAIYNAHGASTYVSDSQFFDNSVARETYGGAAILNHGYMRVTRSRFYENNGAAGIIANGILGLADGATTLIVTDSTIEKNISGTGISNEGRLLVERTIIRDGNGIQGGGIYNHGILTVRQSTLLRNKAVRGGGIYNAQEAKSTFINSTISQNHARGELEGQGIGGGVFNRDGTVYLANATIAENTAQRSGAAIAVNAYASGTAFVYVKRSLIVGHSNSAEVLPCFDFAFGDNNAKILLVEHNVISEDSNCTPSATDIVVDEATTFTEVIAPLSGYGGGRTPTYALLPGSPAIDDEGSSCRDFAGAPIVIDQRGNVRTGCDLGSVDSTAVIPPIQLKLKLAGNPPAIQPNSTGTVDLAILSRVDSINPFRPVVDVDRTSLRLGSAGAVPYRFFSQDLNGDNIADLVMRFRIAEIGIACGDTGIELRGSIINRAAFVASTAIRTTGCTLN
ncbi:MAG: choice-of-anchor Q domain-containing protein [Pseudomonadota bacterium]